MAKFLRENYQIFNGFCTRYQYTFIDVTSYNNIIGLNQVLVLLFQFCLKKHIKFLFIDKFVVSLVYKIASILKCIESNIIYDN